MGRHHRASTTLDDAIRTLDALKSSERDEPRLADAMLAISRRDVGAVTQRALELQGSESDGLPGYSNALNLWASAFQGEWTSFDELAAPLLRDGLVRDREFGWILSEARRLVVKGAASNVEFVVACGEALCAQAGPRRTSFTGL